MKIKPRQLSSVTSLYAPLGPYGHLHCT